MPITKGSDSTSRPHPPPSRDEVLALQGEQEQRLRERKTKEALKPCPFCRCDPVHSRIEQVYVGEWHVVGDTQERAIWYWNHGNNEK